ncbi:uncharacterized mitochondrial protein AtMg00810-like [Nicotiana sylvestris]|uniref:uncharacterized mitochondrial protein AtMg00810-like n=1 Tax=Nicotiana sylvestris TaxID=4096 RepID=UPI00388CA67D
MVTHWLLNSLSKEIGESVIYSKFARDLWNNLEHRFWQTNGAKLYQQEKEISMLVQVVNDFSRGTWTFLLSSKSNAFTILQSFLVMVERQFGKKVKRIRSDNAMELVYVDDILITGNDDTEIQHITKFLDSEFKVKNLGNIHYFLGMEILKEQQGYIVSQRKFTLELLAKFDCKGPTVSSPLDPYCKLHADLEPPMEDPTLYRRLVGKLNYLTNTRPNICFVVLYLSQFMQRPFLSHFSAGLRVLRYLRSDPGQGILLSSAPSFDLVTFCDADWAACKDSRRSISGFFITLGGVPISWKSKKQISISLSSAESEY